MNWEYVVSGGLALLCVGLIVSPLSLFRRMNQTPGCYIGCNNAAGVTVLPG